MKTYDKKNNRFRYYDKNGKEIKDGDYIKTGRNKPERDYEWENASGERGLGTDATNPAWIESGRAVPCEFGIYDITEEALKESEVWETA